MPATSDYTKVPASVIDTFHSYLMDDDNFNEAMMRVALQVSTEYHQRPGGGCYEEDNLYDLAMQLCCRVSVA